MSTNRISKRLQDALVLIVDDDEDILSSIELAMRVEGARTEKCTDGNTAVSLCAALDPDLVILDMMLPRRSGFLVLEKIIESETPPPVIMITANEGRRHMAYARSLGVSAYFNKPVPLERLVTTAAELLTDRSGTATTGETGDQA